MRQNRLSKNIVYNVLNQICNFIVPLILSPYVARVLSAELIGQYSYALANSTYFVLLESLGLNLYGTLEIAKKRDDRDAISKLYKELMTVKMILMGIATIAYLVIFVLVNKSSKMMNAIMLINIIANGIDTTWLFNGLEEFKLISIRNIAVKLINVVFVLLLVHDKSDIYIYALIMQMTTLFGYLILFGEVHKRVDRCHLVFKEAVYQIPRSMAFFVPGLVNTIFSSTDKTILGLANNPDYEVGVYEQANKIVNLLTGVINSISNVILPRVTYEYNNSNDELIARKLSLKTVKGAMLISFPISFGIAAIADNFVQLFFGPGYEKSAILLKILCINVIFSILANYIGQQYLIAKGKQKEYNISIIMAAITNVVLNIALVFKFQSIGVSLASAISAFLILILLMYYCRNILPLKVLIYNIWKYALASIGMFIVIYKINLNSNIITLIIKVAAGIGIYVLFLFILKDNLAKEILTKFKTSKSKNNR